MPRTKPKFLLLKNYLAVAKASVGSNLFRKLYYEVHGITPSWLASHFGKERKKRIVEILRDGNLSCAFFISAILKIFSLIPEIHTTVRGTLEDLKHSGWREIKRPRPGSIIVWGSEKSKNGGVHKHIGIYLGDGKVISNRDFKKSPKIDRWDYRPVEKILWHKKLK